MASTVTLILTVKNVNSPMSVDFRAILAMKNNLMKRTPYGKIPSILMIGSEHQLPFNFPKMKFLPLPDPDKEILKFLKDSLKFLKDSLPLDPNPALPKNLNNNSQLSNNNPNALPPPPSVILLCAIVLHFNPLNLLPNKEALYKTFSTLLVINQSLHFHPDHKLQHQH